MAKENQIEQAWDLIDTGELEAARKIGEQLVKAKEEEGFRIMAALWEKEEAWEFAIKVLEEGLNIYPDSWELWLSLGNMHSNNEDYESGLKALDKAAASEGVEIHWVKLNKSVILMRMMQVEEALNTLQSLTDSPIRNQAFTLKLELLNQISRHDLILELAEEELESLEVPADQEADEHMSQICLLIASACWYEDEPEERILHYLRQAINYHRQNPDCVWLIREMDPDFSDKANYYGVIVKGTFLTGEEDVSQVDFFTSYEVVADSEAEALTFIRAFEVDEVDKESLIIVETEISESQEEDAKGIYAVGGFAFIDEGNGAAVE